MDDGPIHVLHVDDDPAIASLTADALEREAARLSVETVTDPREALATITETPNAVDCVVSDYEMPAMTGIELLTAVRQEAPKLPVILFTGKGSEEVASEAIEAGVTSYFQKGTGTSRYALLANRVENAVAQHRAEQATDRVEQRYQRLIEESSDVIAIVDAEGTYEYVSEGAQHVLGYQPTALVGTSSFEYVHPGDHEAVADRFATLTATPRARETIEFRFRRPDGEWVWVEATGRNLLADPHIGGVVVALREITARRERTRELKRKADLVDALSAALPTYAFIYDRDGTYLEVITGRRAGTTTYTEADLVGEPVEAMLDDPTAARIRSAITTSLETGEPERIEYAVSGEEQTRWYDGTVVPLASGYAGSEAVLMSAHDVTTRQEKEHRLEQFASALSHDLQTPLQVAQGHLKIARDDPTAAGDHLATVADAHDGIAALVEDMLALARDETAVNTTTPVALGELTRACWQSLGTAAATLVVEQSRMVPADRRRLRQLLENLLKNAVDHGGSAVTVTVGTLPDGFYVADDGPGIPDEARSQVLEFGYSTSETGTGVGLTVVRHLATAHDWTVTVTESAADGARVEVTGVEPRLTPTGQESG
jgi:PAS domain S-box-containing protein